MQFPVLELSVEPGRQYRIDAGALLLELKLDVVAAGRLVRRRAEDQLLAGDQFGWARSAGGLGLSPAAASAAGRSVPF